MRNKILLVEDNVELLELLRISYKAAGFSVATASNGIEALQKARSVKPDLVILDLVLPELDGFAVCETLRKAPTTAGVPILLLTGLSSQFAKLAGLESGGTEFIRKPVGPDALISRTRDLLSEKKEAASSGKAAAAMPRTGAKVKALPKSGGKPNCN